MANIVEVVIFNVKKGVEAEFEKAAGEYARFLKEQKGFVRGEYLHSIDKPRFYIQVLEFESRDAADSLLERYQAHVGARRFDEFFRLLNLRPGLEYYEKKEFLGE